MHMRIKPRPNSIEPTCLLAGQATPRSLVIAFCFWASKGSTLLMRQRRPRVVVAEILLLVLPPHLHLLLVFAPPVAGSQASLASMGSADFGRQQRALLASTHLRPSQIWAKICRRVTYCANWMGRWSKQALLPLFVACDMNALRALFPFALLVSCVRADLPSHCDIDHVFGVWRVARRIVTLTIQKLSCILFQ